jgi:FKBP-type peptidyl-prolyl cis-trans isomerase FklB
MKSLLTVILAVNILSSAMAQTKTVKKTVSPSVGLALKTQNDSVSYALGMSLASFYKQQGITNINSSLVEKAINDVMKTGKPLLTEMQMNTCVSNFIQKKQAEKSSGNKKEGEAFLATNKTKPGVVVTTSGLQYQIIKQGDGPKPLATDKVKCHYHGTLIDGTVFESSVDRGEPIEYAVTGFIPGWIEALQLMPVGSKWRLFIPSNLAYGDNGSGPKIKPGSTLIFDLELLEIIK